MRTTEKVVTYITSGEKLLVFVHESDTDPVNQAGLQVPAGTIEPEESAIAAAAREAYEETGLADLTVRAFLGTALFDMRPYAESIQRRHFFWLTTDGSPSDTWTHIEDSGGSGPQHAFRLYWLPIESCHILAAGQSAMLGALCEQITLAQVA